MRVHAEREVGAPPDMVFAFLADLENHWGPGCRLGPGAGA